MPELQLSHWSLADRDSTALQTLHSSPGPARQVKSLHVPSSRRPQFCHVGAIRT